MPIALMVPLVSPSHEYPQGVLPLPTNAPMIHIKQIGILSIGVSKDGRVTTKNMQPNEFISTEVDPNKWGVKLPSSAQNILYGTSVSSDPDGAVFLHTSACT